MKETTFKIYQSFMEYFVGPLVKNEKFILALLLLALGGGLYTVADLLGLTHKAHTEEVAEVPLTVEDVPFVQNHEHKHSHKLEKHEHVHVHDQKDWMPEIRKETNKLYDQYHK